jgi:hypothetical protein
VTGGGFPADGERGLGETAIRDGHWELVERRSLPEVVGTMEVTFWRR